MAATGTMRTGALVTGAISVSRMLAPIIRCGSARRGLTRTQRLRGLFSLRSLARPAPA